MLAGSNPSWTRWRRCRLCTSRPAPTSRIVASATWAAASICRDRLPPGEEPRAAVLDRADQSPRGPGERRQDREGDAGDDADAKREQQHHGVDASSRRRAAGCRGATGASAAPSSSATRMPAPPPTSASTRPSVSTCRTSRRRAAPIAIRTATLAPPRGSPRQHQVGDVGARDQQHAADRAEQHEQRTPGFFRHQPVVDRRHLDAPAPVRLREFRLELAGDRFHLLLRLGDRVARLDPADHARDVVVACLAAGSTRSGM